MRAKRTKYGAVRTNGFASKKEARRYVELRLLQMSGEISGLVCQPEFQLHALQKDYGGKGPSLVGRYVCDFFYIEEPSGQRVHEDVKGGNATKTPLYRWKKKHCEIQYGITIREV